MVKVGRRAARISFAKTVAGMFAGAAGTLVAAAPHHLLTSASIAMGLPEFLQHRAMLALVAALIVGGMSWILSRPVELRLGWAKRSGMYQDAGYVAADPSSPLARRRPIFATDELGAPLMSDEALDRDLGEPEPNMLSPTIEPLANDAGSELRGAENPASNQDFQSMSVLASDDVLELGPALQAEPVPVSPKPTDSIQNAPDASALVSSPLAEFVLNGKHDDEEAFPEGEPKSSIASLIQRLEEGLARRVLDTAEPQPDLPAAAPLSSPSAWLMDAAEPVPEASPPSRADDPDEAMRDRLGALRRKLGN